MTLTLTSDAFKDGEAIPQAYSCEGAGTSVPLSWSGAPDGTQAFALICDDPDAPGGTFSHWAIWNIPPDLTGLPEGLATEATVDGMHQGVNDFGKLGYGPPCPPHGHGTHRYIFRLYALGTDTLGLPANAKVPQVDNAAREHAIAEARLTGTYKR
jgi:Raf kinase inhibitor-like YbhB/YbcL family protein